MTKLQTIFNGAKMDWRKNKEITNFIKHVKKRCKECGVKLKLVNNYHVGEEGEALKCAGYFDSENKELVVSTIDKLDTTGNRWVTLLIHEYNHMEQWVAGTKFWKNCDVGQYDSVMIIDMWLNHIIELNPRQLTKYINAVMLMEKECEENSVKTIKDFNLPFDVGIYTQRANAYLMQYQFIKKHRLWSIPGKAPASIESTFSFMSKKFDMEYKKPLGKKLERVYLKSFY